MLKTPETKRFRGVFRNWRPLRDESANRWLIIISTKARR
jgi:hypothetical protein